MKTGSVLLSRYATERGMWAFGSGTRTAMRLDIHPDAFSDRRAEMIGILHLMQRNMRRELCSR